jgi:hypothetical protein
MCSPFFVVCSSFLYHIFYRDHFPLGECDTLGACFRIGITYGMRYGGGFGDYLTGENQDQEMVERAVEVSEGMSRFWLDMLFFIVVGIILLNIIFGIIIDNFAELRDQKKERMIDTKEFCFICGISKQRFDKEGPRCFRKHLKQDHCMWNYLKFMVHLWAQDQDDDDGLELYVRAQINRGDVDWFPDGTCMSITQGDGNKDDENRQEAFEKRVDENNERMVRELQDRMDANNERLVRELRGLDLHGPSVPTPTWTQRRRFSTIGVAGGAARAVAMGASSGESGEPRGGARRSELSPPRLSRVGGAAQSKAVGGQR